LSDFFLIGCNSLDFERHGHLCALQKKHEMQIGHLPFKEATGFGISPFSAKVIIFGNGS
jgi:hypothetical protein